MKTFKQYLIEMINPQGDNPIEHKILRHHGYYWMAHNGNAHQYSQPQRKSTVLLRGLGVWDHVHYKTNVVTKGHGPEELEKHLANLKEDGPDAPYETPANFNRDDVPKRSTSKLFPPPAQTLQDDLNTTFDQIDDTTGKKSKTLDKPFKSV